MPTATLDRTIDDRVLEMFRLVAEGIEASTAAFASADLDAARLIVAQDTRIDRLQHEIEHLVEARLLGDEPLDRAELRSLIGVLRIVPVLERAGDLVEHIALRTPQRLAAGLPARCRALLGEMGQLAAELWRLAATAYAERDTTAADRLRIRDDALDDLHVSLTAELAGGEMTVAAAIEMGLVARFHERLGDHAVNVARRVEGMV
jgi:phosphate transport system protein